MAVYLATAVLLFVSHALPSAPGIRARLIAHLGRRVFLTGYSLLSLVALAGFVWAYRQVETGAWVFVPPGWAASLAVAVMPLAFFLVVGRLTTRFGPLAAPHPPAGIYLVCRFPGSLGLLVWAGLHLLATGDGKRLVLFATMAAIAGYALVKNTLVLARSQAPAARAFRRQTDPLPFLAMLRGAPRPAAGPLLWRLAAALAAYAALLAIHPDLFGVDPLAGWR